MEAQSPTPIGDVFAALTVVAFPLITWALIFGGYFHG